jgi:hypothetical protein
MKPTGNIILDITFQFSIEIIKYVEILESKRKFVIANQLLNQVLLLGLIARNLKMEKVKLISFIN